mmetsp:Transcript_21763/g.70327  ORF Transcript_21763/g.70327 Transcript_21763/m.70327 type:complete len:108 (-) Transcript_21763:788-1111(-)
MDGRSAGALGKAEVGVRTLDTHAWPRPARLTFSGIFFLIGSIAEVRLFKDNLPMAQRIQIEASLAKRYDLPYSVARDLPTPPRSRVSSLNCNPRPSRVSLRTATSEL